MEIKPILIDIVEAAIGAFSTILFYVILRDTPGPFINPFAGFFITSILITLVYFSLRGYGLSKSTSVRHLIIASVVTLSINFFLLFFLDKMSAADLSFTRIIGGPAIILYWIGMPIALIFELKNIHSILAKDMDIGWQYYNPITSNVDKNINSISNYCQKKFDTTEAVDRCITKNFK